MKWRFIRRSGTAPLTPSDNPYVNELLRQDTHEHDQQRIQRIYKYVVLGLFLLLGGSIYGNVYQLTQEREYNHLIMLDHNYQYVQALSRRADLLPENDPIKVAIVARFVQQHVINTHQRIMDKQFLLDSLNTALAQTTGVASVKLKQNVALVDPFKQIERERVKVIVEGSPIRVSTNTWLANWTEQHETASGDVIGQEKKNGHFMVAEDPKRISPDNVFGLVILDVEDK